MSLCKSKGITYLGCSRRSRLVPAYQCPRYLPGDNLEAWKHLRVLQLVARSGVPGY